MADITKTVKSSSGDYTSLEACLAANQQDLVSTAGIFTAQISGTWSSDDTSNVSIDTWTTNSSYYVRIVAIGDSRHDGTSRSTNAYVLAPTGTSHCIVNDAEYTRIEGIEIILKDNPQNSSEGIRMDASSNESVVNACIIHHGATDPDSDGIYCWNSSGHPDPHKYYVYNCIIYGFPRAGLNHQMYVNNSKTNSVVIRNCTFYDCGSTGEGEGAAIHAKQQYTGQTVNVTIYNTICADQASFTKEGYFTTGSFAASINETGDYNAETQNYAGGNGPDVFSMPNDGANGVYTGGTYDNDATDSTTPGDGNWISFVDITTNVDLHMLDDDDNDCLAAGSAAQQPPSPYGNDVDDTSRADPPDIGADEVPSGVSSETTLLDSLLTIPALKNADGKLYVANLVTTNLDSLLAIPTSTLLDSLLTLPTTINADGKLVIPIRANADGKLTIPVTTNADSKLTIPVRVAADGLLTIPVTPNLDGLLAIPYRVNLDSKLIVESVGVQTNQLDSRLTLPTTLLVDGKLVVPVAVLLHGKLIVPITTNADGLLTIPTVVNADGKVIVSTGADTTVLFHGKLVLPQLTNVDGLLAIPTSVNLDGLLDLPTQVDLDGSLTIPVLVSADGKIVIPVTTNADGKLVVASFSTENVDGKLIIPTLVNVDGKLIVTGVAAAELAIILQGRVPTGIVGGTVPSGIVGGTVD